MPRRANSTPESPPTHPDDYSAILQLGRIALLSNRLDDARNWLERAIALRPDETDPRVMLAEVSYQRDDFEAATAALSGIDVSTNPLILSQYPTLNVAKLQSFKGQTLYELHGSGGSTVVKFLQTDPLPLVSVRINGGPEVTFFIDTGGSEVALNSDFAQELGIPQFGAVQGTFSRWPTDCGAARADRSFPSNFGQWTITERARRDAPRCANLT